MRSVRRASGFVLMGNPEVTVRPSDQYLQTLVSTDSLPHIWPIG